MKDSTLVCRKTRTQTNRSIAKDQGRTALRMSDSLPSMSTEVAAIASDCGAVSYTHLTLPTNREV